jgi:hypothetical protein
VTTRAHRRRNAEQRNHGAGALFRYPLCLSAFAASWTAVSVGGYNIVDYLLAASLVVMVAARVMGRGKIFIDGWMLAPLLASLVVSAWDVLAGTGTSGQAQDILRVLLSTTLIAVLLTSFATMNDQRPLLITLRWWAVGITVNSLAAILVAAGVVSFEGILLQPTGERLSGLSSHPNSIAFSITLALPVCIYLMTTATRFVLVLWWAVNIGILLWALILADSRSGLLISIPTMAIAAMIALQGSHLRVLTVPILIIGAIFAAAFIPVAIEESRLVQGSAQSDAGRTEINNTALDLFGANPIFGAGFDQQIGVAVPLMVLSAGGLVLAVAYYYFVVRPLSVLWPARSDRLAQTGILLILVFLGFGLLNPVFAERATFWPILIAALSVAVRDGRASGNPWGGARRTYRTSSLAN